MWIENDSPARGDYFHLFTRENAHLYKAIHRPVPCLEDPSLTGEFGLYRNTSASDETFNYHAKVEPRASIAPKDGMSYQAVENKFKEISDVRMVSHFLKAIFAAR